MPATLTTATKPSMNIETWLTALRTAEANREAARTAARVHRFAELSRMAATPATFRTPALLTAFFTRLNS